MKTLPPQPNHKTAKRLAARGERVGKTNPNDKAFTDTDSEHDGVLYSGGLTKRECFASLAMSNLADKWDGKYSVDDHKDGRPESDAKWAAAAAVRYADALIEALNETEEANAAT